MKYRVALLHTSMVFFERERLLFEIWDELLPEAERVNIIEDKMLDDVLIKKVITPKTTQRMCLYVMAADAMGVDAIFNTCSSLGPTMDIARAMVATPIVKIDDGMAEIAAYQGNHIGVLATVPTTLNPTIDLISQKAQDKGRKVQIKPGLSEGAFDLLMAGDKAMHDQQVIEKAKDLAKWADLLVLAQCSMARLTTNIEDVTGLPVLSSPKLGITHLRKVLTETKIEH
jgi:Asp/Glu/hydantoin racemase